MHYNAARPHRDIAQRVPDSQHHPPRVTVAELDARQIRRKPVGAENLCHQAIFMNHASGAVTPPDTEVVQVGNAIWRQGLGNAIRGAMWAVRQLRSTRG